MIGQRHGGFLGFAEKVLDMTNDHIWFERGETRDRQMVVDRLTQHCTTGEMQNCSGVVSRSAS